MGAILYINPLFPDEDKVTKAICESNYDLSCAKSLEAAIMIIQNYPLDAVIAHDFDGNWKILIELVGVDIPLIVYTNNSEYREVGFETWGSMTSRGEMLKRIKSINNFVKPSEVISH